MPLGLAPYPRSVLPDSHWEALYTANAELVDWALDDLTALARGTPFAALVIADELPRALLHRYDADFLRDFLVCLVSVGLKLQLPGFHALGCTAEELAVFAMKLRAEELLDERGETAEFGVWDDVALDDADHELLYAAAYDGIEGTAQAESMALAHLSYNEWFVPFNPSRAVHPYATAPEQAPWEADQALYPADEEDGDEDDLDAEDGKTGARNGGASHGGPSLHRTP